MKLQNKDEVTKCKINSIGLNSFIGESIQRCSVLLQPIEDEIPSAIKKSVKCVYCNLEIKNKTAMREHVKNWHNDIKTFSCWNCRIYFKSNEEKQEHCRREKHDEIRYKCIYCDSTDFASTSYLMHHLKKQHSGTFIICKYNRMCLEQFKSQEEKEEHIRQVHEKGTRKKLKCIFCQKVVNKMREHFDSKHEDEIWFRCKNHMCTSFFASYEEKIEHEQIMHPVEVKKMKCPLCQMEISGWHFDRHVKKHHPPTQIYKRCRFKNCSERFLSDKNRQEHEEITHDSKTKWKKCIYCNKLVVRLYQHMNKNHKSDAIKCNFHSACPNYFLSEKDRDEHIEKVHLIENITCIYCNSTCASKALLYHHVKNHHLDVHIRCTFHGCPLFFSSQSECDDHYKQMHQQKEDKKKFQCSRCSYKSASKNVLTRHIKRIHGSTLNVPRFQKSSSTR
jgi:hypothetical protein